MHTFLCISPISPHVDNISFALFMEHFLKRKGPNICCLLVHWCFNVLYPWFIFMRTLSSLHPYFTDELPIANEGLGHDLSSGRSLCFSSHTTTTLHSPDRFSRLHIAPLPLQANCSLSSLKSAVWHPLGWLCRDLWRRFRILNYHSTVAFLSVLVLCMWKSLRINPPLTDWRVTGIYHAKVKAQAGVKTWTWTLNLSRISLRNLSRCLTSQKLSVLMCRRELTPLPLLEG